MTFLPIINAKLNRLCLSVSLSIIVFCSSLKLWYPIFCSQYLTSDQKCWALSQNIKAWTFVSACWQYSHSSGSRIFILNSIVFVATLSCHILYCISHRYMFLVVFIKFGNWSFYFLTLYICCKISFPFFWYFFKSFVPILPSYSINIKVIFLVSSICILDKIFQDKSSKSAIIHTFHLSI